MEPSQSRLAEVRPAAMWNISSWVVAVEVARTVVAAAVVVASAQVQDSPVFHRLMQLLLVQGASRTTPAVAPKAGLPSSAPSPVRVAVVVDRGMEQKEQAEMAVAVVAAGELMLLKQAGPDRTATMAAPMLEAEATKAVLAAAEQVKLAQLGLLAARQVMAAMAQPVVSPGLPSPTVVVAAVQPQPLDTMEMVVLGAAVVEMHRALTVWAVAVAGGVVAPCPQVGGLGWSAARAS